MVANGPALTLDDVLDLRYLGKWAWAPVGGRLAWLWDDGGVQNLWLGDPATGDVRKLTDAKDGVSDFAWRPETAELAYVQDGDLWLGSPDEARWYSTRLVMSRKDRHSQLAWSPGGQLLTYGCAGSAWVYDTAKGEHRELKLPGKLAAGFQVTGGLAWSKDSGLIAFGFISEHGLPSVGIVTADGKPVWRNLDRDIAGAHVWVDELTLLYRVSSKLSMVVDTYLVTLTPPGADGSTFAADLKLIHHSDGDGRGSDYGGATLPSPDGGQILLLLEDDGWAHHYVYDRGTGELEQVTFGQCEDFGHAGDQAIWSPDGQYVIYASNRAGAGYRHLWALEVATGENRQLTTGETTDVQPHISPDGKQLAFVRCDVFRHTDIWVAPWQAPQQAKQLTFGMPAGWTQANQVKAEEVTYEGALGWKIHAQLYRPHGFAPGAERRYPALVWVHGGPIRQMRPTWHPMRSYALFHAYHQYLLHKGYVVLVINFRGGIGYGREFRHGLYHKMGVDDVTDVVQAGRYLKALPYVDPERIAVWGLSYGGYMTLHCLTQYPEEFAMGINIAGIWDFSQWTKWVQRKHGRGGGFQAFFGGEPEDRPDLYAQGSPCTFKQGLKRPLINVQGTDDANVDFEQMDRIVLDCVAMGAEYEAYYYPKEVHTFRHKRTWRDAFPKMEREFEKRLKP